MISAANFKLFQATSSSAPTLLTSSSKNSLITVQLLIKQRPIDAGWNMNVAPFSSFFKKNSADRTGISSPLAEHLYSHRFLTYIKTGKPFIGQIVRAFDKIQRNRNIGIII